MDYSSTISNIIDSEQIRDIMFFFVFFLISWQLRYPLNLLQSLPVTKSNIILSTHAIL